MRLNQVSNAPSISLLQGLPAAQGGRPDPAYTAPEQSGKPPDPRDVEKAVDRLNNMVKNSNHTVEFKIDDHDRLVIKVIDKSTNEVVQQIPSERLLKVLESMDELLGHLLDHKA